MRVHCIHWLWSTLAVSSCHHDMNGAEVISTVRTLGVVPAPVAIESPIDGEEDYGFATFYVALPTELGGAIGRPFVDKRFHDGIKGKMALVAGDLQEHGPVRVIVLEGRAAVPSKQVMYDQRGPGDQLLRYGMLMFVLDGPRERTLAEFWVTEDDKSFRLNWTNPELTVFSPSSDLLITSAMEVPLRCEFTNPNGEDIRISWYVSSGVVANRRSCNTTWTDFGRGPQMASVTINGLESRGAAIQIVDVHVEE